MINIENKKIEPSGSGIKIPRILCSKRFYNTIINLTAATIGLAAGGFTTARDYLKEGLSPTRIEQRVQSTEDSLFNKIFFKNPITQAGRELAYHFYVPKIY